MYTYTPRTSMTLQNYIKTNLIVLFSDWHFLLSSHPRMGVTTAKGNRKKKLVTCLIEKDSTEVTTLTCTPRKFSLASNSGHDITLGLSEAGCLNNFFGMSCPVLWFHICRFLSFWIVLIFCFCLFVCFLMITWSRCLKDNNVKREEDYNVFTLYLRIKKHINLWC